VHGDDAERRRHAAGAQELRDQVADIVAHT
jgi:hypothetical protein